MIEQFFFLFACKQIEGRFVVKDLSGHGIDVAADEMNIFGRQVVERSTFRKDTSNKYMVLFNVRFLPRRLRITEKNSGSSAAVGSVFDAERILEFNSVIGENDFKQTAEDFSAKLVVQDVKYSQNAFLRTVRHQEDEHEVGLSEDESQKDFSASSGAFDGIHFNHFFIGMIGGVLFEILIRSAFPVLVIHTGKNVLLSALTVSDLLRQINVADMKSA